MAIHHKLLAIYDIMTLFKTISGRMAIHHKLLAIYDIMTLFKTISGRMAKVWHGFDKRKR